VNGCGLALSRSPPDIQVMANSDALLLLFFIALKPTLSRSPPLDLPRNNQVYERESVCERKKQERERERETNHVDARERYRVRV